MRRSAGFDIADYIETYYQGDPEIERVIGNFADYIRQETLSRRLVAASPPAGAYKESCRLAGGEVVLGVKRL
jgi:isoleucyl-tRNA synthetase